MVSVKPTKKSAKYSYSERVLRALNQLTVKKRRVSAVHISTLRAQVRKNAEEEDDLLGPQWSKWVAKALYKLDEDGIVDATNVSSLTLTPGGKKVIADQRHALDMAIDSDDVITQHLLLKRAISHAPSRGAKRPRLSIGDREAPDSISTKATRSYKKSRQSNAASPEKSATAPSKSAAHTPGRSSASHRKSIGATPRSKMTKAQLQAELEALQQSRAEAIEAAISQEHEEGEQLQAALKKYQDELDNVRAQLAEAQRQAAGASERREDMGMCVSRESTPMFTPPPSQLIHTPLPIIARARQGVTRTKSGTIIPDHSKQPTPAPSSPGLGDDTLPLPDFDQDVFDSRDFGGQMLTPDPSPNRFGPRISQGAKEMAQLQASFERTQRALRAREEEASDLQFSQEASTRRIRELEASQAQSSALQEQIAQMEDTITTKEAELAAMAEEKSSIEESLSQSSSRLGELERELGLRDATISRLNADVALQTQRITQLEQELAEGARQLFNAHVARAAIEEESEILRNTVTELRVAHQRATTEAHGTVIHLQEQEELVRAHVQRINELAEERIIVEEQLRNSRDAYTAASEQTASLRARVAELEATLSATQAEASTLRKTVQLRDSELEAIISELEDLQNEHTKAEQEYKATIADREATLDKVNAIVQLQANDLAYLRDSRAQVTAERDASNAEIERLQGLLQQEKQQLIALEGELDQAKVSLVQANEEIGDFKAAKATDNTTIDGLKRSFARMKAIHMQTLMQLDDSVTSAELAPLTKVTV